MGLLGVMMCGCVFWKPVLPECVDGRWWSANGLRSGPPFYADVRCHRWKIDKAIVRGIPLYVCRRERKDREHAVLCCDKGKHKDSRSLALYDGRLLLEGSLPIPSDIQSMARYTRSFERWKCFAMIQSIPSNRAEFRYPRKIDLLKVCKFWNASLVTSSPSHEQIISDHASYP